MKNCIIFGIKNKILSGKNVNKFYNWKGIQKINKLEENVKLLGNEVNEIKNEIKNEVKQIKDSQVTQEKKIDELKNLFLNFARQYAINNSNIFDKLNQMNPEQNINNPNDSSKSFNMLKKKRKRSNLIIKSKINKNKSLRELRKKNIAPIKDLKGNYISKKI